MKVLVLGGGGGMGEVAVREAADLSFVEVVTVGDLNAELAENVASQCGPKACSLRIDINDRIAMRDAISSHDIVLNTVGPFYTLGTTVLEQVIEAGRNYADICDDWEPTLAMLELSERAEAKGVTAVIGMGASPGVTNLLAVMASNQLDEVDELLTCWSIEGSDEDLEAFKSHRPRTSGASAAVVHWVQQLTGTIRVLADGGFQDVKPLQKRSIQFPSLGTLELWSVGHPEAVTLPRAVLGLSHCANMMVGPTASFEGLAMIAALVDQGNLTVHQAADLILEDMRNKAGGEPTKKTGAPALFAWAAGRKDGTPAVSTASVRSMPGGGMAGATSVPLAQMLAFFRDQAPKRKGVFAPEEILDPKAFFDGLASKCIGNFNGWSDLVDLRLSKVGA